MSIIIHNISKKFGAFTALNNINLNIPTGHLVALLGPSGCGKTTLLRIIAGLETADTGKVEFEGDDYFSPVVYGKRIGFVFQHYALFRHMNVFENVAFGLRVKPRKSRLSKAEIKDRVFSLLRLVQMEHLSDHYPGQLSGGQRQRVALARVLAIEPKVLLLDEPFGALDARVRQELRRWLKKLHDEIHVTSIFVTHDQEEAMEVADQVVVMNEGKIEQVGTPEEVYHKPASGFVYNFLGNVNLFHGRIEHGQIHIGEISMEWPENELVINEDSHEQLKTATVFLRPHLLEIDKSPNYKSSFRAKIKHINAAGSQVKIELVASWGDSIVAEISHERFKELQLKKNMEVYVSFDKQNLFITPGLLT
ncbi:MAG: sulfate ABC transporter ATP-binding protein [Calditrichaceae bacterium]|nr:sulfate ABC transporter ATP-binding protein [Calditrichaceae bacterium]MBN2707509.1 sulfate ABC transporter ATP-binding protein [Calditrichaceae bacterium]RQV95598.1 MAG: sulfate ABC transporter ATP-binding protein [Calditrichota bacterium]